MADRGLSLWTTLSQYAVGPLRSSTMAASESPRLARKVNKHDEDIRAQGDTLDQIAHVVKSHTVSLARIDATVAGHTESLERIDATVAAIDSRVDHVDGSLTTLK